LKNAAEVAKNQFERLGAGPGGRHRSLVSAGSVDELPGPIPPDLWEQLPGPVDGVHTIGDWELHISDGSYQLYRLVDIPLNLHLTPNQWWQAWVGVNAAAVHLEGIQTSLYHLYGQRENQQAMKARTDEALSALAQSAAQIAAAQAQLDGMRAGAPAEQVAALEARVAHALVAVEALEQERAMMSLASPLNGTVLNISAHPGEVTAAGAGMLSVADLAEMNLVVYVPENRIGQVHLNEEVQIQVDSFPGRVLEGYVRHISDRAEFTPRNVATREERVNLVFAVEIRIANLDGALKPGMPADALFVGR
jgi:biotin carboxyl carrier protein